MFISSERALRHCGAEATIELKSQRTPIAAARMIVDLFSPQFFPPVTSVPVHVDGVATRSCSMQVGDAAGKKITTIEGLAEGGKLSKVQQAWVDHDVPQCGYCQCGMIMAVSALLKDKPKPTDKDIDEAITN